MQVSLKVLQNIGNSLTPKSNQLLQMLLLCQVLLHLIQLPSCGLIINPDSVDCCVIVEEPGSTAATGGN